jgi:uncharacterized protein (TIGR03086 family)
MDDAQLTTAIEGFRTRLAAVDDWGASTPCADWDVRALVNHVVGELLWAPPLLEGKTIDEVGDRFDGDVLGDDPKAAFEAASGPFLTAAAQPGNRERTVHLSFGDFPGSEYLGQLGSDVVIHTWDLAKGADTNDRLDPELVETVYAFMAPQADAWRGAGVFADAVEVGADADTQAKLLGLTGRNPT